MGTTKSLSLTGTTIIYAVGNIASKLISFVLFFVLTFYLSKEHLGLFDIIITAAAVVTPFVSLQLTEAILRWAVVAADQDMRARVFTNAVFAFCISAAVFSGFYWVCSGFVEIPSPDMVFLVLLTSALLPLFQMMARGSGRNALFALSGVVYALFYTVFSLGLVVYLQMKVEGLLMATITANTGTMLFLLAAGRYHRMLDSRMIDISFIRELVTYSVPLIPNALAWWLYTAASRLVILLFLGIESTGIWAVANKIPTILALFNSIFFMAWQEKGLREYDNPDRDAYYSGVLKKYIAISFGIMIVLTAAAKPILQYSVEASFTEAWEYTFVLMLGLFFQTLALFYGVGYLCGKETKAVFLTTMIGSTIAVILNFLLVPHFGLHGAGWATVGGFFAMFAIRLRQTKKYFTITFPHRQFFFMLAALAACHALSYAESPKVQLLNNVAACMLAYLVNHDFISGKMRRLLSLRKSRVYA